MRKPELIAELSCNHLGSIKHALQLVRACVYADSIKIQVWEPDTMCLDPDYVIPEGPWAGQKLQNLYRTAHTPRPMVEAIFAEARKLGLNPFASVFDTPSLDYLESLGCPRYKVASFELVDLPLIQAIATTGKPMIMSTGMATDDEIAQALTVARRSGAEDITLLHCVSSYPAASYSAGLLEMQRLRAKFNCPVGFSDHTLGMGVPIAAAVLGAEMIEKHISLTSNDGGPDGEFSMNSKQLMELSQELERATQACTSPAYPRGTDPSEQPQKQLRRSLYWAKDVQQGQTITREHLTTARPAQGLQPSAIGYIVGMPATENHRKNTPVKYA